MIENDLFIPTSLLSLPDVSAFLLSLVTGQFFTEGPQNHLGNIQMQVLPDIVGIPFLLMSEFSFWLWFLGITQLNVTSEPERERPAKSAGRSRSGSLAKRG